MVARENLLNYIEIYLFLHYTVDDLLVILIRLIKRLKELSTSLILVVKKVAVKDPHLEEKVLEEEDL